jgi:hypothetical protein
VTHPTQQRRGSEASPILREGLAHLVRIHALQDHVVLKSSGKPPDKLLLEQLEVPTNLNIVTRGPRLYDSGSRVNLGSKVDLLGLDENRDKGITNG